MSSVQDILKIGVKNEINFFQFSALFNDQLRQSLELNNVGKLEIHNVGLIFCTL